MECYVEFSDFYELNDVILFWEWLMKNYLFFMLLLDMLNEDSNNLLFDYLEEYSFFVIDYV